MLLLQRQFFLTYFQISFWGWLPGFHIQQNSSICFRMVYKKYVYTPIDDMCIQIIVGDWATHWTILVKWAHFPNFRREHYKYFRNHLDVPWTPLIYQVLAHLPALSPWKQVAPFPDWWMGTSLNLVVTIQYYIYLVVTFHYVCHTGWYKLDPYFMVVHENNPTK